MIYIGSILFYIFISCCYRSVYSIAILGSTNLKQMPQNEIANANNIVSLMALDNLNQINYTEMYKPLVRVKKASEGAGKFTQAANVEHIKSLRMFLQLFKNSWDSAYIGGSHPLHPNVPKAVISLYKLRIVDYFFPPIGEDPKKSG